MNDYVALLRGINVGGHNLIKMEALKGCFEKVGLSDVRTYIQSGNVLFRCEESSIPELSAKLERALGKAFSYSSKVVVRSRSELADVVRKAPEGFGGGSDHRYNVAFLRAPTTIAEVMAVAVPTEGVDVVTKGPGVVYFATVIAHVTKSTLRQLLAAKIYQNLTIRNFNTTTKLATMISQRR